MSLTKSIVQFVGRHLSKKKPFRLLYWDGTEEIFGHGAPAFDIRLRTRSLSSKMLWAPDPAWGDAYVNGILDIHPLSAFFDAYLHRSLNPPSLFLKLKNCLIGRTGVSKQYREIQSHYDRGNAFFSLWLDPSKTYSCAYFRNSNDSLEAAQQAKITHVLRKACLTPGQRLLDIGSGWGALIMEAAQRYGVRPHGITLSRQQYEHTQARIHQLGLEGRVSVELKDYRELAASHPKPFDRIVSVGMMEHVGRRNLPVFLGAIERLLAPQGVCVLHSMTRIFEAPTSPWVRKNIFPGCYVPGWQEVIRQLPRFSFHLIDLESLRRHYAETLMRWATRFEASLPTIRELGFDERFIRMWRFYLHACAASFRHGVLDLHQLVLTHGPQNELPRTRDHLYPKIDYSEKRVPDLLASN